VIWNPICPWTLSSSLLICHANCSKQFLEFILLLICFRECSKCMSAILCFEDLHRLNKHNMLVWKNCWLQCCFLLSYFQVFLTCVWKIKNHRILLLWFLIPMLSLFGISISLFGGNILSNFEIIRFITVARLGKLELLLSSDEVKRSLQEDRKYSLKNYLWVHSAFSQYVRGIHWRN